jgi:pyruvate dehydrogenase (quinone)
VLNNSDLNQVTWEQRVMSGDPKLDASQVLPDVDYAAYARLLGLHGERVEDPTQVGAAWDRALAAGRPAVLDIVTDPEVPPLPPHVAFEQAKALTHAIADGDPAAPRFMKQSLRAKLAELLAR